MSLVKAMECFKEKSKLLFVVSLLEKQKELTVRKHIAKEMALEGSLIHTYLNLGKIRDTC